MLKTAVTRPLPPWTLNRSTFSLRLLLTQKRPKHTKAGKAAVCCGSLSGPCLTLLPGNKDGFRAAGGAKTKDSRSVL